ncbi:PstS family phosphate ABC transporter substrate-binding protein [Pseudophaeobacter sp. TrK17]|uniref:PstS family phosphate ABC transporter substrate-binding protein n=1 Tax=Pseudophaeobacter sp. TrK17 TaxID=2815167 RepID=UPI0035CE9D9B
MTRTVGATLATLVVVLAGAVTVASAETIRIGGTGVALGGMRILGTAFEQQNAGTTVEVLPSLGSSGGVRALLAGAVDLSVASRALKDKETDKGAVARLYATTPLALVTSEGAQVDRVTTEELAEIYSGARQTWPSGETIRVVLRPISETDTKILRVLSAEMAQAVDAAFERQGLVSASNDQENAETLERLPGALGVVAIGQIATEARRLKVLRLDGSLPNAEGSYAQHPEFVKSLYLVTTGSASPVARAFVDYVLSEEGQAILASYDHIPVR